MHREHDDRSFGMVPHRDHLRPLRRPPGPRVPRRPHRHRAAVLRQLVGARVRPGGPERQRRCRGDQGRAHRGAPAELHPRPTLATAGPAREQAAPNAHPPSSGAMICPHRPLHPAIPVVHRGMPKAAQAGTGGPRLGSRRRRRRPSPAPRGRVAGRRPTLGPLDLGGGEAQARSDLVGHDLDLGAALAVLGLPGPLLDPAGHHHPHALGQAQRGVLGQLPPAHHVEERGRLLPLLGLPVLPAPVDGHRRAGVVAWPSRV